MGDGIKFIEENAVADHGTSPNGKDTNAVRILIVDVDSSDLRCSLSTFLCCGPPFSYCSVAKQFYINTTSDLKSMVTVLGCLALQQTLSKMSSSCQQKSSFQLGVSS